jgi:antitoxin ParD1/3/4
METREEIVVMTTVTVSLPDSLKDFLDAEAARGGYATPGDYLRALVQEEHERLAQAYLEELLMEGLQSEASEMTSEDWKSIRRDVHERHASRAGA